MSRTITLSKLGTTLMLLALPVVTSGCASGGWGGWSLTPWNSASTASSSTPSSGGFSLNPWKGSANNQVATKEKPSNNVPTPPASMLAGSGMANAGNRGSNPAGGGAPTYNANNYQGTRPAGGVAASSTDYSTRQASATGEKDFYTGPYSTNGGSAQQGPYSAGGSQGYANADRRGEASYGAANSQGYNPQSQVNGGYQNNAGQNSPTGGAYNASAAAYGAAPNNAGTAASPYQGATGHANGVSRGTATAPSYAAEGYRPGSTSRGGSVQPASFDNNTTEASEPANYPLTAGGSFGDEAIYR